MKNKILNKIKITPSNRKALQTIVAPILWRREKTSIHRHSSILNKSYNFMQEPAVGAVIYCQLATAEHSGIYIGNGSVIELDGRGHIKKVSLKEFTGNLFSTDKDIFIPVIKHTMLPIGDSDVAEEAINNLSKRRKYNLLDDNCHQFVTGCMIGDLENDCNFLFMVKEEFANYFFLEESDIVWVRWKWYLD